MFSYAQSQVSQVLHLNQEEHHKMKTFRQEYVEFLEKFEIEHKPEFLFEWYG